MNNDTSVQGGNEPLSHLEKIRHLQAQLSFLHEVVDRMGCISDQWHDHVQQHRAVLGNPELVALSAKMRGALLEFYRHACFLLNEADFKVSKAEADYVLAHYQMGSVPYDSDFTKVGAPPDGKRGCRMIEGHPDSENDYATFYEDGAWGRPVLYATTRTAEPMRTGFTVKRMFGPGQKCLVLVETESESEALDTYTKEFGPVVSNTTVLTEKIKFRTVPEFHEAPWVSLVWAPAQGRTP